MTSVAFVTPTHGRPELHEALYQTFKSQTVSPKRLYVLDTSEEASPFFSALQDPEVVYAHRPGAFPREPGVNRIGAVRNYLNSMVTEDVIAHLDDDDWLHPEYGRVMLERLGDAALVKLDVWRLVTDTDPSIIFEWDTRSFGGRHYALQGDQFALSEGDVEGMPSDYSEMFRDGYGFSMMYPRSTWEQHPYPEDGTEDFPFVREVRDAGEKIIFVSDLPQLVLHLVSSRSKSGVYPQKILGLLSKIRDAARMLVGLSGPMQEIAPAKKIQAQPGVRYTALVALADKHPLRGLATQGSKWGLTIHEARDNVQPSEFGVNAPPPGYRLVHLVATVDKATEIPWSVPAPLSAFDKTHVVKAWTSGLGAPPVRDRSSQRAAGWWWGQR